MALSGAGTDLEAQFRLRVFALLNSTPALHQLIMSKSDTSTAARLDLARFLAAYYVGIDLARLFEQLNRCHHVQAVPPTVGGMTATKTVLPNLMVCAELDDREENYECLADRPSSSSAVWDRSRLGQLLPSECSPNFALRLLLREHRCLEAIFFADHFHDSRTSMALRFLVDRHFPGLSLLAQYCRATLIDQLLDAIEFDEFDGNEKRIHQFIEAVIQADVLLPEEFGTIGLLNECLKTIATKMAAQFSELLEFDGTVDEPSIVVLQMTSIETVKCLSPLLPRPPIYCSNFDFGMTQMGRHSLDTETRAWVTLQTCCSALGHALARSNRLEQLVGFFALWLGRQNEDGPKVQNSDVPFLLEAEYFTGGNSDAELAIELDTFQTMFSIALGVEIRDKLVRQLAETMPNVQNVMPNSNLGTTSAENGAIVQKCHAKLCALVTPFYEGDNKLLLAQKNGHYHQQLIWPSLRRWAQLADQNDIESAMLFLHTIQQQNTPTRRFLPQLNAQNRPKWCSFLLMDASSAAADHQIGAASSSNWVDHLEVFVDEQQKFRLITTDFTRLRFLAYCFQMVPLRSQPIQMLLQFDPNEICTVHDGDDQLNEQKKFHLTSPSMVNGFNSSNDQQQLTTTTTVKAAVDQRCDVEEEKEDSLDQLIAQIRTSLDMLDRNQNLEQSDEHLNVRQKDVRVEKSSKESSSEDKEHLKLLRARHHVELIKKQKHHRRKVVSNSTSSALNTFGTSGRSSTSSSRSRNIRRRTLYPSKKIGGTSSASSPPVYTLEEPSDEQLMDEMATIGQRLEWIRQQFQQRTEGQIERDEMPTSEEDKWDKDRRDHQLMDGIKLLEDKAKNEMQKSEVFGQKSEKNGENEAEQTNELAHHQSPTNKNAEIEKIANFGSAKVESPHIVFEKPEQGYAEIGKTTLEYYANPTLENGEEMANLESAKVVKQTIEKGQIEKQNAEIEETQRKAKTEMSEEEDMSNKSLARKSQSTASSAGYHSSRPSTSTSSQQQHGHAKGHGQIGRWQNAEIGNVPTMMMVERMDFRGLRSSEEEEEEIDEQQLGMPKKTKVRSWKEIEVFPRNSPTKLENPTIFSANKCAKSMPKSSAGGNNANPPKKEEAAAPRRSLWRRPQWLRLLPPFDGTIRTERQTTKAQIKHERPLLELQLGEHFLTPRGSDKATTVGGGGGCDDVSTFLSNPGRCRRRTFLELAAKKERHHRSQNSGLNKTAAQQQQKHQQSSHHNGIGIYDSGIGLEQQQQQKQKLDQDNNNNNIGTTQTSRNGIVLYTVELDEANVEAMRRRAAEGKK